MPSGLCLYPQGSCLDEPEMKATEKASEKADNPQQPTSVTQNHYRTRRQAITKTNSKATPIS